MQVFCPYPDLQKSVSCLDPDRLGNQIYREGFTLIKGGWPNHPAAQIWANHKYALAQYCLFGLEELQKRERFYPKWFDYFNECLIKHENTGLPDIIGYEPFHLSHKSKLISKNKEYYLPIFGNDVPENLEYVWKK